jgi:hypothetical protein
VPFGVVGQLDGPREGLVAGWLAQLLIIVGVWL